MSTRRFLRAASLILTPVCAAVALFAALLYMAAAETDSPTASSLPPGFVEDVVSPNMASPMGAAWARDGRMFVHQKAGVVRVFRPDGVMLGTPFIAMTATVNSTNDRGLLGFALHPDFPATPYAYLLFTYDPPGVVQDAAAARVSRLIRVTAYMTNTSVAIPGSEVVLLGTNSTRANIGDENSYSSVPSCESGGVLVEDCLASDSRTHAIGHLAFGSEGALYVSVGDGSIDTTMAVGALRSQNLDSPLGKILRIDPLTGSGLVGNPFYDAGNPARTRSKVWSYGLRNPFRFAIRPGSNQLYIGDVGWGKWEELNYGRGRNFGWPCYEGDNVGSAVQPGYQTYSLTQAACNQLYLAGPGAVQPAAYAYPHRVVGTQTLGAAIVAGVFYTGTVYPEPYRGALFFGDYSGRAIYYATVTETADLSTATATTGTFATTDGGPMQFSIGPDGNVYYASMYFTGEGTIRRIRYAGGTNVPPIAQAAANPDSGPLPLTVNFSSAGTSDPDGQVLTYTWSFGNGITSSQANPVYVYVSPGIFTAMLTVTDDKGASTSSSVPVYAGNTAPVVTIATPAASDNYVVGQNVSLSGMALDAEDGPLPDANLSWAVTLHHNEHVHPDIFSATGANATFTIPDHGDNTYFDICLTAQDLAGLTKTTCRDFHPQTVPYRFETDPSGLSIVYEGVAQTTPYTATTIVGSEKVILAPQTQGLLSFAGWADGVPGNTRTVVVGAQPGVLRARYVIPVYLPMVMSGN